MDRIYAPEGKTSSTAMVARIPACVWRIGWLSFACALLDNYRVSSQSDDGYWPDFFRNPVGKEPDFV